MSRSLEKASPDVTKLRSNRRNYKGGNNAKPLTTRKIFLAAYEEHFGNVTAACYVAGISRQTFYRWMRSPSRINVKFRGQLERIRPDERLKDLIESAFVKRIQEGSDSLIKVGLERKVRDRGYGVTHSEARSSKDDQLERVALAFGDWAEDHPTATPTEKIYLLERFAERGGVEAEKLAEHLGLGRFYGRDRK
jgi:hypothetical protein